MRDSKIDQKQPVVKEIAALLDGAQAAVVVDYRGLTVAQDTELRKYRAPQTAPRSRCDL